MMDNDVILDALLAVSLTLSVVLVLLSAASAGRAVVDLERQAERGVTGGGRIQAWVNVRAHIGRALLGLMFIFITVLLLADAPMDLRTWSFRILFMVLLGYYTASSVLDWRAEKAQVRLGLRELAAAHEAREVLATEAVTRRVADALADHESYRQIADEAVRNLEAATNQARADRGEPPLMTLAAVVPEHNSPTTIRQQEIAAAATLRARLVAATLALGLPARAEEKDADLGRRDG
jgi:hypothetical protein